MINHVVYGIDWHRNVTCEDYEKRSAMRKLVEEMCNNLNAAEIEVEKAAMMTGPLGGDHESFQEIDAMLSSAQSVLARTWGLVGVESPPEAATGGDEA